MSDNHSEPRVDDLHHLSGFPAARDEQKKPQYRDPADFGHWEGEEFVFDKPFKLGGEFITRLQTKGMVLQDGITREDVIHALINPASVEVQQ